MITYTNFLTSDCLIFYQCANILSVRKAKDLIFTAKIIGAMVVVLVSPVSQNTNLLLSYSQDKNVRIIFADESSVFFSNLGISPMHESEMI